MATFNVRDAKERTTDPSDTLKKAFQQVMQGLSYIQEAVLEQERRLREIEQEANASSAGLHRSSFADSAEPPPPKRERRQELGEELKQAAEYGMEDDVRRLLDGGVDINFPDSNGWTPLMWAAYRSRRNVVTELLGRGANIHARTTNGVTALHFSCLNDYSGQCASLLIRAGAPVHSVNNNGRTPLHYAAQAMGGNMEAARVLLAAGASRTVRDWEGKTPWDSTESSALRRLLLP